MFPVRKCSFCKKENIRKEGQDKVKSIVEQKESKLDYAKLSNQKNGT